MGKRNDNRRRRQIKRSGCTSILQWATFFCAALCSPTELPSRCALFDVMLFLFLPFRPKKRRREVSERVSECGEHESGTTITCDRHNDDEKYNSKKQRHKKGKTGNKTKRELAKAHNEWAKLTRAHTHKYKKRNNKNNSNKNEKQWKKFAVIYLCMRY